MITKSLISNFSSLMPLIILMDHINESYQLPCIFSSTTVQRVSLRLTTPKINFAVGKSTEI